MVCLVFPTTFFLQQARKAAGRVVVNRPHEDASLARLRRSRLPKSLGSRTMAAWSARETFFLFFFFFPFFYPVCPTSRRSDFISRRGPHRPTSIKLLPLLFLNLPLPTNWHYHHSNDRRITIPLYSFVSPSSSIIRKENLPNFIDTSLRFYTLFRTINNRFKS